MESGGSRRGRFAAKRMIGPGKDQRESDRLPSPTAVAVVDPGTDFRKPRIAKEAACTTG